nr:MAG TPA: hypothetical protein [Caudoviricetes sp.]DAK64916.1 MAG TPA: hypothetical protein [Caudoviricetes sp.]DAN89683.1 MAG TPA: hypothetical protein [Caudoviricetes sp.]DAS12869.1 MAG TPA: hypothetical protein [Caudoviricetes sp.]DAS67182.1 MAG TPA: hypothetical protein [Caudoviricetes sp.]
MGKRIYQLAAETLLFYCHFSIVGRKLTRP